MTSWPMKLRRQDHEVDAVVADALLQRVERGGLGVLVGLPVEPVEVEEALEGPADVLADASRRSSGRGGPGWR